MITNATVIKYGDNVDTDVIIPARYLNTSDPKALAAHCMEDIDKTFVTRVKQGDVMAAGNNFGCGSSREHAPLAIKESGVACVVAKSFARIFYRNAINIGLPIIECDAEIYEGDSVSIDFEKGMLTNHTTGQTSSFKPFPEFLQKIIAAGGLLKALAQNA
ncbi:3-isopropylmalate dehydratase small subunit [Acetanaerobacterium elongatum]|uniref:3-isopropylmalate dehydratase small subunit n=1 Tax=Acetanaerobacterium elongatum TaxID=258515 RepID=A0A1H0FW16_9FIRM|nr:3-isopropylmalate dehydratase small subunit [Acetanaerobacterium elongatum]SDN98762.1 3-isopropylmalate/(R)-2-methylmalate dehydratase small subunit [Acetanaerobacterium elongatum]